MKTQLKRFLLTLGFMTRIPVNVDLGEVNDEDMHKGFLYYPVVGLVIGLVDMIVYLLVTMVLPETFGIMFAMLANFCVTGAFHLDGLSDTADGIYSARTRERMLEIMKDSHVGSNAVIALVCLVLLKVAAYTTLPPVKLSFALVAVFVATRTFMVTYIVNYKYARKTGIGHMFKAYAKPMYTYIAFALCLALVAACGLPYLYTAIAAFVICQGIAHFLSGQLGGLTGDTYGFLTECGVVVYLMLATYII